MGVSLSGLVLPYILLSIELASMRHTPMGAPLHVRLTTTVGSYATRAGAPVTAVLIAPVVMSGETVLPEGSVLSGYVKSVARVGLGIVHEKAALALEFNQVTPPGGESFPISAQVEGVDNGREQVDADGNIHGERSTSRLSYRVSGYIRTALSWEIHAGLAFWAIKTLIVQVPEPELYFPAGVELTLKLTGPLLSSASAESAQGPRQLTQKEYADLDPIVETLPYRAYTPGANRPSDLVNMMFIGSRKEIDAAFAAAGWTEARRVSFRSNFSGLRAVAEGLGSRDAPMSSLLVNDAKASMSWQKGLDDYWKRDHIRLWKQSATYDGQEIWVGAATRDVNVAFMRPGQRLTHRIEEDVDRERDKVAHDLEFTSCVDVTDLWDRAGAPRVSRNATGDPMSTDTGMAVIRLNTCQAPRLSTQTADSAVLPRHGNGFQRILRRQILSARSDYLRTNIYWRGYEGTRWMIAAIRRHRRTASEAKEAAATRPLKDQQPASKDQQPAESLAATQQTGRQRSESVAMSPFSQHRMGWLW